MPFPSRVRQLTYLASPYTHDDPQVRQRRFEQALKTASRLMGAGEHVYAPICYSHPFELAGFKVQDREFWLGQELPILRHATKVRVLCLEGWESSEGVTAEIELATELGIPVEYIRDE